MRRKHHYRNLQRKTIIKSQSTSLIGMKRSHIKVKILVKKIIFIVLLSVSSILRIGDLRDSFDLWLYNHPLAFLLYPQLLQSLLVFAGLAHSKLGQTPVKSLQENAGLAHLLTGDVPALLAQTLLGQPGLGLVPHHQLLPGVDNIDDTCWSDLLQVFDIGSGVTSVGVRAVDTLRAEVVQLLEISVHHYLLLVCVLERFAP